MRSLVEQPERARVARCCLPGRPCHAGAILRHDTLRHPWIRMDPVSYRLTTRATGALRAQQELLPTARPSPEAARRHPDGATLT